MEKKKNDCLKCRLPADKRTVGVVEISPGVRYHSKCIAAAKVNKGRFQVTCHAAGDKTGSRRMFPNEWAARLHAHDRETAGSKLADIMKLGRVSSIAGIAFQHCDGIYTSRGYYKVVWDDRTREYITQAERMKRERKRIAEWKRRKRSKARLAAQPR